MEEGSWINENLAQWALMGSEGPRGQQGLTGSLCPTTQGLWKSGPSWTWGERAEGQEGLCLIAQLCLKRWWITWMAGEHPSSLTVEQDMPMGEPPWALCSQTGTEEFAPHLFSVLSSPCRNPHSFAHRVRENHQPQGPYPALLVQIHPCLQTKLPNFCSKCLGANPDLAQGLNLPITAMQSDFHNSSEWTVAGAPDSWGIPYFCEDVPAQCRDVELDDL